MNILWKRPNITSDIYSDLILQSRIENEIDRPSERFARFPPKPRDHRVTHRPGPRDENVEIAVRPEVASGVRAEDTWIGHSVGGEDVKESLLVEPQGLMRVGSFHANVVAMSLFRQTASPFGRSLHPTDPEFRFVRDLDDGPCHSVREIGRLAYSPSSFARFGDVAGYETKRSTQAP